ncbi:hypothetical protein VITFI_CDS1524 [Vitreoscilla filiformis]|uniref:SB domain-containing protein n=1 Tax=Vitreoscilla filiformis TaxID=63 RepID=A0A221KE47_VITFI|nr:hypothetical protein [Vitreoscilla filiformis]ASM75899.1 hypothetical protein VITFI_CDS0120 [Vitreoscilla filiformis]ASM76427.1 hypothetical protein VITFI_CDS0648 [Vitreoscilla filiformis]ASM76849.1 hypothetical protein VITFI_CDS1071 [Vitreoscilla filiformis]ASM77302.1 hypothetical protein VITFI_CDS1524 [Vitreoscilla filiformis]
MENVFTEADRRALVTALDAMQAQIRDLETDHAALQGVLTLLVRLLGAEGVISVGQLVQETRQLAETQPGEPEWQERLQQLAGVLDVLSPALKSKLARKGAPAR